MRKLVALLVSLPFLAPVPGEAQEPQPISHVYEAYSQVNFADLEEWNRLYWEHDVPILTALRDEGLIQGWSHSQHETGGEYNVRLAIRVYDWASIDTFWGEYLSRLEEAYSAEEWERSARMTQAHHDDIWSFGQSLFADPQVDTRYMYAATFKVNFADMDEWDRLWQDKAFPIIQRAIDAGQIGGVVKLNHNTGGPHNSKILYMFEDWDQIDDFLDALLSDLGEDAELNKLFRMIEVHDDVIWAPVRQEGM